MDISVLPFIKWCEERDLNPHGITIRPSNVRVCQFRHPHISIIILYNLSLKVKPLNA